MAKRSLVCLLAVFCAASVDVAGQNKMTNSQSWSGVIINSGCTVDEASAEAVKCTEKVPGANLVLYDDTTRQMFDLDPQPQAVGQPGDSVMVHGVLDANTIRVSFLELLTSIGLPVGEKAPDFSARDQCGQEHTLEGLKGPNGTVLLMFRSADW